MTGVLAFKLTLVPTLMGGITLAGRRWGPAVAGWLSAFPVVSGPILFFVALDDGAAFASTATVATLTAVLAILAFGLSYAWSATHLRWLPSALIAFSAWFAVIALLNLWTPTLPVAAAVIGVALLLAPRCYPSPAAGDPVVAHRSSGDLVWRMLVSVAVVIVVTHFSARMGAHLSGLFAMFPALGSILAIFSHRDIGGAFTIRMLRGMVLGYYSFAVFCVLLSLTLMTLTIPASFAIALAAAAVVHAVTRVYL